MRRAVLVALLVLASVPAPAAGAPLLGGDGANDAGPPGDPEHDVVGWEDGYWHNESVDVDQSDGLSDAELDRYVARAMARVEYIRDREFKREVPVSVISREAYRNRTANESVSEARGDWNNQVWEALFVVGEDTDVQSELDATLGSSVAGFYVPRSDEIRIITTTPEEPTIDNATLHHELVHALQDQYYDLTDATYRADTQDATLGIDGVVEGEANYIEARYADRCGEEWDCVETPEAGGGGGASNLGLLVTTLQPYSDGPVYVDDRYESGGWAAVDRAMEEPPTASEQTIHLTDEEPANVTVADTARDGWERYSGVGDDGGDTVGEASIFTMFWYQSTEYGAGVVEPQGLFDASGEYDLYDYDADVSDGWNGDRVVPYRRGDLSGYVWVTEWDTDRDARQFVDGYRDVLATHDASERADGVLVIGGGNPWADAFRVVRDGRRVTVVNAPTPRDVDALRPDLAPATPTTTDEPTTSADDPTTATTTVTTDADDPTTAATTDADDPTAATTDADDPTTATTTATTTTERTSERMPGFGVAAVALAVGSAALFGLRRA